MSHINNLFNFQVNSISSNASINFGNTIHRGHSVNKKQVGGQNTVGPSVNSPTSNFEKNIVSDPDFVDQPQRGIN